MIVPTARALPSDVPVAEVSRRKKVRSGWGMMLPMIGTETVWLTVSPLNVSVPAVAV